ncbi:alpha-catulin isoform X2 [Anthonomus grandis grandis]|uniref:alpha-catulin isoform X2 n=1 Tax=Anthonomus grandis grandis TaxID=2921223 RepID=UPI0021650334|nr:alpha-catulin isoform X2 [Anthonomus grandis grandis]
MGIDKFSIHQKRIILHTCYINNYNDIIRYSKNIQNLERYSLTCYIRHIHKISSLVEHGTSTALRPQAVARVGQAVNLAVERFVTVGETIADDYQEIRQGMYEACKEARQAGGAIEHICEEQSSEEMTFDRSLLIRAAKCLLSAITRVLLLADIVVVKQLLLAKDKVSHSLDRLESVSNFTEFVKAFSQFGAEMVELAHLTGDRQNDLKDERRRAQMAAARQVLERSTMMLLTASKTSLRHPENSSAKENRDTVFCQMRRAMDLIHYVVKDGVLNNCESSLQSQREELENDRGTAYACMRHLQKLLEHSKVSLDNILHTLGIVEIDASCQDTLPVALEAVLERTQDFTDSAYTSHEHREAILEASERLKAEMDHLLGLYANVVQMGFEAVANSPEIEESVQACINSARDLSRHLANAGINQAQDLNTATKRGLEMVAAIRQQAMNGDIDRLHHTSDEFQESIDHILEVCKLLRHVAVSETLQVSAKFTEINLRVYGPQVVTAAKTVSVYPSSKIAQENLEVFAEMYQWLVSDVTTIVKDVLEASQAKPEKQVYMSLPRPGKHGTTSKPLKAVRLDTEEQEKIAKSGLEMKLATSEMDAETDKWQENNSAQMDENNDIVKRAKNMSSMAFSMYQFTKGEGPLKTTQDLFTQAEYFAEEANRLYKVIRQFSYQVPGGAQKKDLLENLDKVPTFVQRLQFTVKDHTVGKAATFTKVDNVIQETKNLMNVISKVVTVCFECATKYKLEFRGCGSGAGRGMGGEGGSSSGGAASGDSKGGTATGSDQSL